MSTIILTDREIAILQGFVDGLYESQIARRLHRSQSTTYRATRGLLAKLGASSPAQAVDRAWRLGLLGDQADTPAAPEPAVALVRVVDPPELIRYRRAVLNNALAPQQARDRRAA